MAGYEQTIIVGNVGRDPELRQTQSGASVTGFSVAVTTVISNFLKLPAVSSRRKACSKATQSSISHGLLLMACSD